MDRARLKTFVLLLLILVNLTFLGLIAIDAIQTMRLEREMRTELVWALRGMDISIEESQILQSEEQALYFLSRDPIAEARIAANLLGQAEGVDEGGGVFRYAGLEEGRGEGEFRSGSFHFQLGDQQLGEDYIEGLLNQLELTARSPIITEEGADTWRTYTLLLHGLPLVNGEVTFLFSSGMLQEVFGTSLWGSTQRYAGSPQVDVTTALISLGGHLLETAEVSRFEAVEMGYYLLEEAGVLELRPVWIIRTDGGTFSVDRQSGEIR